MAPASKHAELGVAPRGPVRWKSKEFEKVISKFYTQRLHQSWKNVLSRPPPGRPARTVYLYALLSL